MHTFQRNPDGSASILVEGGETLAIRHIIGIGRNYAAHADEQGAERPDRPMLFTKNPASVGLPGEDIVIPRACQDREQVDYEGELAVVIARPARDIAAKDYASVLLGYCVANDVSARWWQKQGAGGQFHRGKSFDTFCPLGPGVIPAAQVPDPQALRLVTTLNGETVQDAPTSQMMFPVPTLIEECSRGTTLLPGTVILTGTPAGVGMAREPQRFLRDGDVVEVAIEGVGAIRNTVRAE
ncbi:MAG: fumarylacetoacetate hydrolase family protein [Phycisphaeraceae bacterium]|nr:fumarylacetoacetate hydrolase family protein [Phycisphaeraceae bacterium]MCB9847312.1 fumarylacetoacetate hydrolase family protein [Phycisphaeraceae bacterium]